MAKQQKTPEGWTTVAVALPPSVQAIIAAAGGADPSTGGMPHAMAVIVGALPWIAAGLYDVLTEDEYRQFAQQLKDNMQMAWSVAGAQNPRRAFDEAFARAQRSVQ